MFAYAGCQHLTVYFNAIGNSKLPFYANLLELPINVISSLVLIYGWGIFPEMGLVGAAIGSAIAVTCRLIFLVSFKRKQALVYEHASNIKLTFFDIKKHLSFATPIAGTFISMVLANSVCMMIYAKMGVYQFAALTLINPWIKVAGQITLAWATATGIIVGQILGSNEWSGLDQFIKKSLASCFLLKHWSFNYLTYQCFICLKFSILTYKKRH